MRKSKRLQMKKSQNRDFYQIPKDCEEEIQRSCEFVNKLKELGDKRIFVKFIDAMKSYQSKTLTYIDLKTKVAFILRNHDVLLQDLNQLLSDLAAEEKNRNPKKSDVDRTVEFLNKLEALGKGLHGAFLNQLAFADDIPTLVSQLDSILRDHSSLKKEFRAFLIDSGLLKKYEFVTPSYMLRPEFEEESSSDLNGKYVSVGHAYESDELLHEGLQEVTMNKLEDELLKKDMYYKALKSVVKFGKSVVLNMELNEKPPVGFNEVIRRFYAERGKKVPQKFKTEPKLALLAILPTLRGMKKEMRLARKRKVRKTFATQRRRTM